MKSDGSGVKALTSDPTVRHNFGDVSWDGKTIYYASNKRDRNFFDVYSMDLASGRETLLYSQDGNNDFVTANGSGTKIIISRDGTEFSLDNSLYLVDTQTRAEVPLTPHKDASQYFAASFVADGIVLAHNDGREFASLAEIRRKNAATDDWTAKNRETILLDDANWDVGSIEMQPYGSVIAYTLNRDGFSELYFRKYETDGKPLITVIDKTSEAVKLPGQGIVGGMSFNHDQSKLVFAFGSAKGASEIWIYDLAKKELRQMTWSDRAGIAPESFIEPHLVHYKTYDGREISAWFYEPPRQRSFSLDMSAPDKRALKMTKAAVPVIVSVHGGPEGQERPGFSPLYQYYLSRGYAILATERSRLDGLWKDIHPPRRRQKREDSVKDLAYAVEWLKASGNADPKRIAVMGGSYGGYMTLAAITLYPELWAAAVDTVGIANWESFLKNTSGYRRRQREVEYGSLDKDIDFLRSVSPLKKVDRITTPLFVIAGRNDPRVPYTEAEQIVGALRKRGAVVEYKLYDDEGHGVTKLKNRLELYPLVADFLDKYMK